VEVFLGAEYNEDGEEIEALPTENEVLDYENTFKNFLENIDEIIIEIKEKSFENYKEHYAEYYEKSFILDGLFETDKKEGEVHEPLNITTQDIHFEYMKNINYLRVLNEKIIIMPIHYKLDREHGLEIILKDNKVIGIDGMGVFGSTYHCAKYG